MSLIWLSLTLPSLFIVHRLTGWTGVCIYLAASACAVRWVPQLRRPAIVRACAAALCIGTVMLFAIVYPAVNTSAPGLGSDDDDAHDVGVQALLAGDSPYRRVTYLGNTLHQLPGSYLLALPFTLLGTSALQNLFWLAAFFAVVWREGGLNRSSRMAILVLGFSPAVLHGVVTGTAHVANAIYAALGLWWVTRSGRPVAAAALWGVALASRPNFLLLMPLAWAWLRQHRGSRTANVAIAMAAAVVTALVLPFYAADPAGFGPLDATDRLTRFDRIVPYAGAGIAALMAAATLAFMVSPMSAEDLFRNGAIVQAIPVVVGLAIVAVAWRQIDLEYATYGTFAAWLWLLKTGCPSPFSASR